MDARMLLGLTAGFTAVMWVPYVLARMGTIGVWGALDNPTPAGDDALPDWAKRAKRAHLNAVENLVVCAALVVAAPSSGWTSALVAVYLGARVVHFLAYTAGIPVVRTLAFAGGFAAQLGLLWLALGRA